MKDNNNFKYKIVREQPLTPNDNRRTVWEYKEGKREQWCTYEIILPVMKGTRHIWDSWDFSIKRIGAPIFFQSRKAALDYIRWKEWVKEEYYYTEKDIKNNNRELN